MSTIVYSWPPSSTGTKVQALKCALMWRKSEALNRRSRKSAATTLSKIEIRKHLLQKFRKVRDECSPS